MDLKEDCAKSSSTVMDSLHLAHHRLDVLEADMRDIRSLTAAMAAVNEKVDNLKSDVNEIKSDVKEISKRPTAFWDRLVSVAIGAIVTGIIAAFLQLILK